jgi:hypothetical protein
MMRPSFILFHADKMQSPQPCHFLSGREVAVWTILGDIAMERGCFFVVFASATSSLPLPLNRLEKWKGKGIMVGFRESGCSTSFFLFLFHAIN